MDEIHIPTFGAAPKQAISAFEVRELTRFIDENLGAKLPLEILANQVDMSVCYFCRAFKAATGVTPHQYIMTKRLEQAVKILGETNISVKETALAVGYADNSAFSKAFKRRFSMSPVQYRNRFRKVCKIQTTKVAKAGYAAQAFANHL